MSINVYTATQADLQSLTGIGPKSASEIVALRNQVLAGQRDPICILDLAEIRLQPDTWQQYINDGLFSITYTPPYQPLAEVLESADNGFGNFDEPIHIKEELTPILPAPKHTLTLEQATLAQSDQPEPGQIQDNLTDYTQLDQTNTTEHLQIQAVQTQTNQPGQTELEQAQAMALPQTQDKTTEKLFAESIAVISHEMDGLGKQIFALGNTLTHKITQLANSVVALENQNTGINTNIKQIEEQNTKIQKQLTCHEVFLQDIKTILPPPTPIASKLPIFTEAAKPKYQLQATTMQQAKMPQTVPQTTLTLPQWTKQPGTPTLTHSPITSQPGPYTIYGLHPTYTPSHPQTSTTPDIKPLQTLDLKPKHPQQSLIDNIASAIPISSIYQTKPHTETTVTTSTTYTTTAKPTQQFYTAEPKTDDQQTVDRGRPRTRQTDAPRDHSSQSPRPQKLQLFSGDPSGISWLSFIMKFDRISQRRGWSEDKKLDRLYDCLTDKALKYAARSDNRDNFAALKSELALRFDLKEEPVAARQQLHLAKQGDDETLEVYLQHILAIAMDGYKGASAVLLQQMATEAFLRGCRHKDAATLVMNEAPQTIHVACKRIKTMLANKKAIGGKVSFSERIFTVQEETRVSNIEKKVDDLLKTVHRPSTPPRLASPSPPRYSSGYQGQSWQRPRSPDYYRGGSPNGHKYPQRFSPSRQGRYPYRGSYSPESYHRRSPSRDGRDSAGMGGKYPPAQYPSSSGYNPSQYGSNPDYRNRYSHSPNYNRSPSPRYRPPNQHYPQGYPPRYPNPQPYPSTPPWPYGNTGPRPSGPAYGGSSAPPPDHRRSQSPKARVRVVSEEQETTQALNLDGLGKPATNP